MQRLIFHGDIRELLAKPKTAYYMWAILAIIAIGITIVANTVNFNMLKHGKLINLLLLLDANPSLWWAQMGLGVLFSLLLGWIGWHQIVYLIDKTYLYDYNFGFKRSPWLLLIFILVVMVFAALFLLGMWVVLYEPLGFNRWIKMALFLVLILAKSLVNLALVLTFVRWMVGGLYYQGEHRRYWAVFWGECRSGLKQLFAAILLYTFMLMSVYVLTLNNLWALQSGVSLMKLLRLQLINIHLFFLIHTMMAPLLIVVMVRYVLGYTTIKGIRARFTGSASSLLLMFMMVFLLNSLAYTLMSVLQFFVSWQTTFSLLLIFVVNFFQYIIFSWVVIVVYNWLVENMVLNDLE